MYQAKLTIAFSQPDFAEACVVTLREYGVVVIEGVYSAEECAAVMEGLTDAIVRLSDGFDPKRARETWKKERLPPSIRDGLIRTAVSGTPTVTRVRGDPRFRRIFSAVYTGLRGRPVDSFVTSVDSINYRPPVPPFFDAKETEDWPHVDVTSEDGQYACVQGQVVVNDSTACFVCSPKSHLLYGEFLNKPEIGGGGYSPTNWNKYNTKASSVEWMTAKLAEVGGRYQIPIVVPKGSVILWLSSTIHSARTQLRPDGLVAGPAADAGKFPNYRGVIYVCLRPRDEVGPEHIRRLKYCEVFNRQTNHWGEQVFSSFPPTRSSVAYTPKIRELATRPESTYSTIPPERHPDYMRLLGYSEEEIAAGEYLTTEDLAHVAYDRYGKEKRSGKGVKRTSRK
jgi:hypothetical protein